MKYGPKGFFKTFKKKIESYLEKKEDRNVSFRARFRGPRKLSYTRTLTVLTVRGVHFVEDEIIRIEKDIKSYYPRELRRYCRERNKKMEVLSA